MIWTTAAPEARQPQDPRGAADSKGGPWKLAGKGTQEILRKFIPTQGWDISRRSRIGTLWMEAQLLKQPFSSDDGVIIPESTFDVSLLRTAVEFFCL